MCRSHLRFLKKKIYTETRETTKQHLDHELQIACLLIFYANSFMECNSDIKILSFSTDPDSAETMLWAQAGSLE